MQHCKLLFSNRNSRIKAFTYLSKSYRVYQNNFNRHTKCIDFLLKNNNVCKEKGLTIFKLRVIVYMSVSMSVLGTLLLLIYYFFTLMKTQNLNSIVHRSWTVTFWCTYPCNTHCTFMQPVCVCPITVWLLKAFLIGLRIQIAQQCLSRSRYTTLIPYIYRHNPNKGVFFDHVYIAAERQFRKG